jgi:SAM-dependent methyltransferase
MRPEKEYYRDFGVSNPGYSVVRIAGRLLREKARRYLSGRMLEIGCGAKRKALLVGEFVTQHIGLDHDECPHDRSAIDLFGSALKIPAADESFDSVLCTAVLEHLEDPREALREAHRVLKRGGCAIYTVPLIWHLHEEPRDFYRFTRYGVTRLAEQAGFEIVEITALSGFWITFGTELGYYLQRFKRGPLKYLINGMVAAMQWALPWLERGFLRDERFAWAYLVVLRKGAGERSGAGGSPKGRQAAAVAV